MKKGDEDKAMKLWDALSDTTKAEIIDKQKA